MRTSAILAAALLAACSQSDAPAPDAAEAPGAAPEAAVEALHMYVLDCGVIEVSDLDIFSTAGDYAGVSDTFTDACFLVRHPQGDLMWDLGLPGLLTLGGPQTTEPFTISLEQTLTEQIEEIGLAPSDIDYVAVSHSHFDHSGQADQFPDSTWLVYRSEYELMFPPQSEDPEQESDATVPFLPFAALARTFIEGEHDVFGDGSVVIVPAPGHTPGHAVLQVTLPQTGPVLLTGDLYHRAESRELRRVPQFNWDVTDAPEGVEPGSITLASMDAFEARAAELGARVIIQHEPADVDPLPKPPEAMR
ncbi:MAG: N-acyl homoserine lactonase family protein [Pseudomonadota bacterium]